MTQKAITIMLVDDHAVVREGYRRLIEKQGDMAVVAEAADGVEAYRLYKSERPEVAVIDLSLPGKGGIEVLRHIRKWDERARILVFTMHQNAAFAAQAFKAGALGFVTKSSEPKLLISAIRDVSQGRRSMSPDISLALALMHIGGQDSLLESLTAREFEIFRMIAEAHSAAEIAEVLNLSAKTVSNYRFLIRAKLGVGSDIELAHLATRLKIVDPTQLAASGEREED